MGRRYHRGIGVPVDFQQALLWYKKAAERNDAARFLVAAVLEGSAKASPGEIDAPTMYRIAALPLIESVSNAPVRAPVVRDHDQLADLEGLPLEPFAQRLRDALAARTGVATGATDVVPASAAPPALIDTKVVLGVPGAAGGTSVTSAAIPLPVISSTIKPGQAGPTPFPSQFSHDAP